MESLATAAAVAAKVGPRVAGVAVAAAKAVAKEAGAVGWGVVTSEAVWVLAAQAASVQLSTCPRSRQVLVSVDTY